jgi:dihydroorotate dehydrogenase
MMRFLYRHVLKPILFRFDPEWVHHVFVTLGETLGRCAATRRLVSLTYGYRGPDASVTIDTITYRTPVVLAAGFDYNGRLVRILKSVGFGGMEVGSVTARPNAGNPPPRLRRLVQSKSLLVNKGLRNDGVEMIAQRLRHTPHDPDFVVGVSIARTNDEQAASVAGGIADYHASLQHLVQADVGDFYTVNISCPNVHGGESFAEPLLLRRLLESLRTVRHERPMYVKMPIDLEEDQFDSLLDIVADFRLRGVVIGNLHKDYDRLDFPEEAPAEYQGGISGRPCFQAANRLIRRTREKHGDRLTIIGCGGILDAEDAMEHFRAGADLVQLVTGMIFEGPHLMKRIARAYAQHRLAQQTRAG